MNRIVTITMEAVVQDGTDNDDIDIMMMAALEDNPSMEAHGFGIRISSIFTKNKEETQLHEDLDPTQPL